jgi:protease II
MEAGHSGKTGRFQYLEEYALEYGFLLVLEGITE